MDRILVRGRVEIRALPSAVLGMRMQMLRDPPACDCGEHAACGGEPVESQIECFFALQPFRGWGGRGVFCGLSV